MAKTYDVRNVRLVIGGFLMTGFEEGSEIDVDRYEDGFSMTVGIDGKVVRSRNNNKSGHIDFTLQRGNPLNAVLSALATLDETNAGAPVPVLWNDVNAAPLTPEMGGGRAGWVKKKPPVKYGAKAAGLKWVIDIEELDLVVGGYA